jgi:hypothetical protein
LKLNFSKRPSLIFGRPQNGITKSNEHSKMFCSGMRLESVTQGQSWKIISISDATDICRA